MRGDCLRCPLFLSAQGDEWQRFIADWWDAYRDNWTAAHDLLELAVKRPRLGKVLGDGSRRSQQTRLGRALAAKRGERFGPWQVLVQRDLHRKSARYRLVLADFEEAGLR